MWHSIAESEDLAGGAPVSIEVYVAPGVRLHEVFAAEGEAAPLLHPLRPADEALRRKDAAFHRLPASRTRRSARCRAGDGGGGDLDHGRVIHVRGMNVPSAAFSRSGASPRSSRARHRSPSRSRGSALGP